MNYTIKSMHYKEKCEKTNKFTILLLTDETRLNYIECTLAIAGYGRRKPFYYQRRTARQFALFLFVAFTHLFNIAYFLIVYSQW